MREQYITFKIYPETGNWIAYCRSGELKKEDNLEPLIGFLYFFRSIICVEN